MNKKIKELGKALIGCGAIVILTMIPVFVSLVLYYLSLSSLRFLNSCNDYTLNLESFLIGSVISSIVMFFFLIFLIQNKKLKMEGEKENA